MEDRFLTNSEELSLYVNTVETFFKSSFPQLEKNNFWSWFLKMLTGKECDINNLSSEEVEEILIKLKEFGDLLFDPEKYNEIN
jgi:hypothetical protein